MTNCGQHRFAKGRYAPEEPPAPAFHQNIREGP